MATTMLPPTRILEWTSGRQDGAPADIIIKCGGETFRAHKDAVCPQSQKLQEACNGIKKNLTVTVHDDTFDAPTMNRMLEFLYHGEYDIGTAQNGSAGDEDDAPTKLDVLSHLFCYAIGESYMVKELSDQGLANFDDTLRVVTANDFAELVEVIVSHTEALPVHRTLRQVTCDRLDELAECKRFVRTIGCQHLTASPEQQDGGESAYTALQATKQLATFGTLLFRYANQSKLVTTLENNKLARKFQEALQRIELLRKQVDRDSTTLRKDEEVQIGATEATQAAEAKVKQANSDLAKVEDQAARVAQAFQKTKLELEVLRNAEHNNKQAREKVAKETVDIRGEAQDIKRALEVATKEADTAKSAWEERSKALARERLKLNNQISTAIGQQRRAQDQESKTLEQRVKAVSEQKRYGLLQSQITRELAEAKTLLVEADQKTVVALAENKILREKCEQDLAAQAQSAQAENKALRDQFQKDLAAQVAKYDLMVQTRGQEVTQDAHEVSSLRAEVNQARLNNFTLQISIYDLQYIILNSAESREQLLDYDYVAQ